MKSIIAILTLLSGLANAATWERPAGGYTPTNHSINTTKYQTDRANNVAISSVKVDGDLNKAFQGLNDIEARTPPSVVGQAGKFLTNNGSNASWEFVQPVIGLTVPDIFIGSSYPNAISLTLAVQAPNSFLAGPVSGTSAVPTMRPLAPTDLAGDILGFMRAKAPPEIANSASDPVNDIDIGTGSFVSDNGRPLKIATSLTKQLDNAWSAGTNAGGLFAGSKAPNTWYAVFAISNGSVTDVGFDTSSTGANAPSGYTDKRRIGWVRTDASGNILQFRQTGDFFGFVTPSLQYDVSNLGTARALATLMAPPRTTARIRYYAVTAVNNWAVIIQPTSENDVAPSFTVGQLASAVSGAASGMAGTIEVETDASSQVAVRSNVANATLRMTTVGYFDRRGRDE